MLLAAVSGGRCDLRDAAFGPRGGYLSGAPFGERGHLSHARIVRQAAIRRGSLPRPRAAARGHASSAGLRRPVRWSSAGSPFAVGFEPYPSRHRCPTPVRQGRRLNRGGSVCPLRARPRRPGARTVRSRPGHLRSAVTPGPSAQAVMALAQEACPEHDVFITVQHHFPAVPEESTAGPVAGGLAARLRPDRVPSLLTPLADRHKVCGQRCPSRPSLGCRRRMP